MSERQAGAPGVMLAWLAAPAGRPAGVALALLYVAVIAVAWYTLVAPGASFTRIWLNDVLALINASYRTFQGQMPVLEFNSFYGPAAFWPPALGFHLGLQPATVLPLGSVSVAALALLGAGLMMARRFSLLITLLSLLYLLLLMVVPMAPGLGFQDISWGTYYNRQGWAALAVVLLFYVPPLWRFRGDTLLDAAILTALTLFLFYSKLPFGMVALAFLLANAVTGPYNRRMSLLALMMVGVVAAGLELATGLHGEYLSRLVAVSQNNDAVRNGVWGFIENTVLLQAWVYLACLGAFACLLRSGRWSILDAGYALGVLVTAVMLLGTTGGTVRGMPTVVALFLVCGELCRRGMGGAGSPRADGAFLACTLFLLMFIAEPVGMRLVAWQDHYHWSSRANAQPVEGLPETLQGMHVRRESWALHEELGHSAQAHAQLDRARGTFTEPLPPYEFLQTIAEGVALLQSQGVSDQKLFVLDNADAFTVALGLPPTTDGSPMLWATGTLRSDARPSGDAMFTDTDWLMIPVLPHRRMTRDVLWSGYGDYIEANFSELATSPHWRLLQRRRHESADPAP